MNRLLMRISFSSLLGFILKPKLNILIKHITSGTSRLSQN